MSDALEPVSEPTACGSTRPTPPLPRPRSFARCAGLAVVALLLAACGAGAAPEPPTVPAAASADVGPIERASIESRHEGWRTAREGATPNAQVARALASVPPGAEVVIFLGVWCSDSRREVPRLWKAFDEAGGSLPFAVSHVGVDEQKHAPGGAAEAVGLRYVPTILVRRGGREVGRIVESAPGGVEQALLDLLTGARTGVVSERTDLGSR
jgi:hypothetical protein